MGKRLRRFIDIINGDGKISVNNVVFNDNNFNTQSLSNIGTFNNIKLNIQNFNSVTSDPVSLEEGEIWYNSIEKKYKVAVYDSATTSIVVKEISF